MSQKFCGHDAMRWPNSPREGDKCPQCGAEWHRPRSWEGVSAETGEPYTDSEIRWMQLAAELIMLSFDAHDGLIDPSAAVHERRELWYIYFGTKFDEDRTEFLKREKDAAATGNG